LNFAGSLLYQLIVDFVALVRFLSLNDTACLIFLTCPIYYLASQEITKMVQFLRLLDGFKVVGILFEQILDLTLVALLV
jgi:hypothetical protein